MPEEKEFCAQCGHPLSPEAHFCAGREQAVNVGPSPVLPPPPPGYAPKVSMRVIPWIIGGLALIAVGGIVGGYSWGIAIDLHKGNYWKWGKVLEPAELPALQSDYPWEVVAAFEAQGFIWGGKWYHFDTMHFEYRPELLATARLLSPGSPKGR